MDVRENFKEWCNKVIGGETLIVLRPKNENVVIVSEKEYNELAKAKRNEEYLKKLDRSFAQLEQGEAKFIPASNEPSGCLKSTFG